jgi:hypothetical protein
VDIGPRIITARGDEVICPYCHNQFEITTNDLGSTRVCNQCDYELKINSFRLNSLKPYEIKPSKSQKAQTRKSKESRISTSRKSKPTKQTRPKKPGIQAKKPTTKGFSSKQIQTGFDNLSKIENFMKDVSKKKASKPNNIFGMNKPKPPSGSIIESMKKSKKKPKPKKKPKDKNDSEENQTEN